MNDPNVENAALKKQLKMAIRERKALRAYAQMVFGKLSATSSRLSYAVTSLEISVEMVQSKDNFVDEALDPMKAALMAGRLNASGIALLEHVGKIGKEFELKRSNLKMRIEQANEQLETKSAQLNEGLLEVDELKRLSNKDLKEVGDKWQSLNTFMMTFQPVFEGARTEWGVLKNAFKADIEESLRRVVILESAASMDGENNDGGL